MTRGAAIALVVGVFLADQATKLWILHGADFSAGAIEVLPFMDLTLVWNRGISYGLLQQDGDFGRWLLAAFTALASVFLAWWLWRTHDAMVRLGAALILGGALGNLVDRVVHGAVVDFVHLHYAGYSWYVFNIADAAIVFGVLALVVDGVFGGRRARTEP